MRISIERCGSEPLINAMLKTLLRCGFLDVISSFLLSFLCPAGDSNSDSGILESHLISVTFVLLLFPLLLF